MSSIKPTQEQQYAIDQANKGDSFKILAYAGAGKTATLQMISQNKHAHASSSRQRGMYLAFNKAIATDAQKKFSHQVDCRTFHSLAYRHVPRNITTKINLPRFSPAHLAKALDLQPINLRKKVDGRYEFMRMSANQQASLISDAVSQFCTTHASYPAPRHLQLPKWLHQDDADELRAHLYPLVEQRWLQACDPSHNAGIGHDIYLKLWALSKPRIPVDYILFDEAQDADPLMLGILLAQQTQVIYVGDAHQQIYEWRGATNAMKKLPLPETRLTQSFRFGENIGDVANVFLRALNEDVPLVGNPEKASALSFTQNFPAKDAILCRTNATAMMHLIDGLRFGHKVALQADSQRLIRFADASEKLKIGKPVKHIPELAYFQNWTEVLEYTETNEGSDLKSLVKIIDDYGSRALKSALNHLSTPDKADYVISTAHKSKGLEWQNVQIADDYNFYLDKDEETGETELDIKDDELRLLYVACTRAKNQLNIHDINNLIACLEKQQDNKQGNKKSSAICDFDESLSKTEKSNRNKSKTDKPKASQNTGEQKKYQKVKGLTAIQQAKLNQSKQKNRQDDKNNVRWGLQP